MHKNSLAINALCLLAGLLSFFPVFNETIKHFSGLFVFFTFFIFVLYHIIVNKKYSYYKKDIKVYFFLSFWLTYGIASSIWTYDIKYGLIESFKIAVMFLTFFLATQIINRRQLIPKIFNLFIVVFLLYLVLAFWEIITFNHLPTSRHGSEGVLSFVPYGPFYNRNDMAAILLMLLPFPLFKILQSENIFIKIFLTIAVLFVGITLTLAGARIGMIFYVLALTIFSFIYISIKSKIAILITIILAILFIKSWQPFYYDFFEAYLQKQITSVSEEQDRYSDGSINIRKKLIAKSIDLSFKSKLLGVGSGNIPAVFAKDIYKDTQNTLIPHNFFIEIFTSYGLVILLIFLYILSKWFQGLYYLAWKTNDESYIGRAAFFSLLLFIPASILPSSIFSYNFYWIIFAFFHQLINFIPEEDSSCPE